MEKPLDESTGSPRILVIGDCDFASDDYLALRPQLPGYGSDLLFFFNAID